MTTEQPAPRQPDVNCPMPCSPSQAASECELNPAAKQHSFYPARSGGTNTGRCRDWLLPVHTPMQISAQLRARLPKYLWTSLPSLRGYTNCAAGWVHAKPAAGVAPGICIPLLFNSTALAGARPPFTVGLVTRAWLLANAAAQPIWRTLWAHFEQHNGSTTTSCRRR